MIFVVIYGIPGIFKILERPLLKLLATCNLNIQYLRYFESQLLIKIMFEIFLLFSISLKFKQLNSLHVFILDDIYKQQKTQFTCISWWYSYTTAL